MVNKCFFLALLLLLETHCVVGQRNKSEPCPARFDSLTRMEVFTADNSPTVTGGMQALGQEISRRIKYPRLDHTPMESKVIIAFVVDIDGTLKGKRIVKNITGTDLGKQLLDIVTDMTWYPGTCEGKIVPTFQVVPMTVDFNR